MRAALQVEIAGDQPAQVRRVRDAAAAGRSSTTAARCAPMIITKYFAGIGKTKYM